MKRTLIVILVLLAFGAAAYYPLLMHSPAAGTPFPLDIAQVRALADSAPGERPREVRAEHVLTMTFFETMTMAGASWEKTPMPVYAFQLVYPDRTVIVDAAQPLAMMPVESMIAKFDQASYDRMLAAMDKAALIVVTHEHADHFGGVAAHPRLAALKPALRLTREQLANAEGMKPAEIPAGALDGYEPLAYEGLHALAPGVVLIKAPGHTPGSQMVYVRLADGRELLFLGDVSWRMRNIAEIRERPLLMTWLIGEDRHAVLGQFAALNALAQAEPGIRMVPGHDEPVMAKLFADGVLVPGFGP